MANFDAMVPLIPKDTRVPVDHAREQMKVNQVEKIQELRAVDEEESGKIDNNEKRENSQQHQQQQQQSTAPAEAGEASDDDGTTPTGHIDTYA
ncbi:hypothetical protein [Idiomarina sp. HP20-50]|uniref:hypothetical protein n=1 Tax=Idiomarina sp. HP20-50 TaxID=3070813 RepID=UPI00294B6819|nr:hypothetical protein [Idiomarina sp. HP20-50]MDV6317176.1 hypothetical protein [Idiomarina sp. HP20-50]